MHTLHISLATCLRKYHKPRTTYTHRPKPSPQVSLKFAFLLILSIHYSVCQPANLILLEYRVYSFAYLSARRNKFALS
ncbi:hypothetical protein Pst134EA_007853 [Puccinia striiformis f. sp. tritici]|uniref:hypothetical protein n=1 Tax=Puccinia striiformis f. sp. tritici TaxID=168172 RepID=UPI002007B4E5|nr:hypothetical protein Pst134EA_007853 [Puccinia striiformis f. sp. tritici]KAH9460757.1 hypothetical protein Pst134EB_008916 [Puccinia striiformis f. sp. tritici]KAH9470606.1 hypothetical protein Pst134EA_007853 [Puccinia striiformis f. sp. tritici]